MCGIAGILNLSSREPVDLDTLKEMVAIQRHRGPDECGVYIDDHVGLGHARLIIIDPFGGTQPLHNEDRTLWIVYNGEIFNYPELRQYLEERGHNFYTRTDTEVILHLFEEKGPACLEELNGQFAFAIWNTKDKQLFLARDRVGILPLHYCLINGRFLFASEIKALLVNNHVKREIDHQALDQIFTFWTTLPGRTFFKDIMEIPAGHYGLVSGNKIHLKRYWDLSFEEDQKASRLSMEEVVDRSRELIRDAVHIRLRADVPVGSYLSGGLDSSGITAFVRREFDNKLRTFGISFEDEEFDERKYQQEMVDYLKVNHTQMEATNREISSSLTRVLWHCEKPLLRTAPVPLYLLSKVVRERGFKVVLTGEGADEVFGGYNIFREAKVRAFWARDPGSTMRPLLIRKLYPYVFRDRRLENTLINFFGQGLQEVDDPLFSHRIRLNNSNRLKRFFSGDHEEQLGDYDCLADLRETLPDNFMSLDVVSRAQYLESILFMSTYLLSLQGDRMAMAHSVETRPPYLDHRIIELMCRTPSWWKIRGLKEKYILKQSYRKILPPSIVDRPKQPYRAPIQSAFNKQDNMVREYLGEGSLKRAGLFDWEKTGLLVKKIMNADRISEPDEMALTGILSTQIIYEQFVDSASIRSAVPLELDLFHDNRSRG